MREFDDAYMGTGRELKGSGIVGFGHSNRTPASSRVSRTTRKVKSGPPRQGLSRSEVVVKRVKQREWHVFTKNGADQEIVAVIQHHHMGYGYTLRRRSREEAVAGVRPKPHGGFSSLKSCVDAMLVKL